MRPIDHARALALAARNAPPELLRRGKLRGSLLRLGPRSVLLALLQNERIAAAGDLAHAVHDRAGAGRNQPADNDVLLEAVERIDLAADRRFGQHPRRLLEGGG